MTYDKHLLHQLRRAIGQSLQRARHRQKMTLTKLAHKAGVNRERLDQFEIGKNDICLEELLRLSCALKLPLTALMRGDGECLFL